MQSADHAQTSGPVYPHENKTYTVFAPPGRCCQEYIFLLLQSRSVLAVNKNKGQAYTCPADKKEVPYETSRQRRPPRSFPGLRAADYADDRGAQCMMNQTLFASWKQTYPTPPRHFDTRASVLDNTSKITSNSCGRFYNTKPVS